MEQGQVCFNVFIEPGFVRVDDNLDLATYIKKFVLNMAGVQLNDDEEYLRNELHLTGKPDIPKINVKYPINFEIHEDGRVQSCVVVSVPYVGEGGINSIEEAQHLQEHQEV